MDTAPGPATAEPAFHADDVDEVVGYRTLSALAIVGLLFGLASPLCLLSPVLLVIPLCGAALSIIAMRRIAASDGLLAGRWAAAAGLALCVAAGIAAVSHGTVTRYLRTARAESFAHEWLQLLAAGEIDPAFRLTAEGARPQVPRPPDMPAPETTPYEDFTGNALIQEIAALGGDVRIETLRTEEFVAQANRQFFVQQRYAIRPSGSEGGQPSGVEAVLTLHRSRFPGDRQSRWLVSRYEKPRDVGP